MKKGILKKQLLLNFGLILFISIIIYSLNKLYLRPYAIEAKRNKMIHVMEKILKEKQKYSDYKDFYDLENHFGVNIRIMDKKSSDNHHQMMMRRQLSFFTTKDYFKLNSGEIISKTIVHNRRQWEFLIVAAKSGGNLIIIDSSIKSIADGVNTANIFVLFSALVASIFGMGISYYFSNRISKPIKQINKTVQKMAEFNFNDKLNIKTGDELEQLSNNINFLSFELEKGINEIELSNEKLKKDMEKKIIEEQNRAEFIANMTHEIKTPISLINMYSESLLMGIVDEDEKNEYLKVIIDEGKNISKLVENMLNIEKLNHDESINMEEHNLYHLFIEITNRFRLDVENKNINLNIEIDKNQFAFFDRYKISQVINNIFANAISHIDERAIININSFKSKDRVVIEIENSGEEIEKSLHENLWEPFYRVDNSGNKAYGGTGLGLTICKKIFKLHGSNYGIKNSDIGVIFWFDLKTH